MKYYLCTAQQAFDETKSTAEGLSESEAAERLRKYGYNKLAEPEKASLIRRFLAQLADPMILVLIAAAVISFFTSLYADEGFADVIIIVLVVLINAVLGVYQESKAEKAIEALQAMSAAECKVLRDGQVCRIHSENLTVGDVVLLEAGDSVPADGRITESASLKTEEAALTGESVPVSKFTDPIEPGGSGNISLGDRSNMVYMGSTVAYGRGRAVVTAVGMDTEMGKIADALARAEEGKTPLQIKLSQLSRVLTALVIAICVIILGVGIIRAGSLDLKNMLNSFMVAVSLAVAAIPEGLAAVVTVVLSIGVTNMSRRRAIIRKLTAVETLGCAQIICSDKTGTLTQNKMTVVETRGGNDGLLAKLMALCSDAEYTAENVAVGEPTEAALVEWAARLELPKSELKKSEPRIGEAPFDSMRKMMSTVHDTDRGIIQYTKGAPDEVLRRCTHYLEGGMRRPMDDKKRSEILAENSDMAARALRVLMGAINIYDEAPGQYLPEALEQGLCYIGLVGMTDPVRPEVRAAIDECSRAGIRPIMITGDHAITAAAIAKELGILRDGDEAVTGAQLDAMDDEEFRRRFRNISVYARVQPENKTRIVNAWRAAGYITAMTGDGVNDAPSIKSADIGVGMGITGTDVTKSVADMVLADDNFATIVGAVEEGRRIYDNIRKAIQFLLGSNMSEVLAIFAATLIGFRILSPVHLLWINLATDCFPALSLGTEKAESGIMNRGPRRAEAGVFSGGMGVDIVYQGVMIAALTMAAYFIGYFIENGAWGIADSAVGTTMAFLTMSMSEVFHSLNMRSQRGSIFKMATHNGLLYLAEAVSFVCTTLVVVVPFLRSAFGFTGIGVGQYAISMLLALSVIPIVETVKFIQRKKTGAR